MLVVSFKTHRLLFNFDYTYLEDDETGNTNVGFIFKAEVIQLLFTCLTFLVLCFIEVRYNKLDIRVVYKSNSKMDTCSSFIIFFWSIFCLLWSVTLLPTTENCESDNICTCKYDIDKTLYGCNQNSTN